MLAAAVVVARVVRNVVEAPARVDPVDAIVVAWTVVAVILAIVCEYHEINDIISGKTFVIK